MLTDVIYIAADSALKVWSIKIDQHSPSAYPDNAYRKDWDIPRAQATFNHLEKNALEPKQRYY